MSQTPIAPTRQVPFEIQPGAEAASCASAIPDNCPLAAIVPLFSEPQSSTEREKSAWLARGIAENCPAGAVLRHSEEQYRLLFESNPIPMWVFDRRTLQFVAVNEAAIQQYGFSEQEFLERTIAEIRPEEDIPELIRDVSTRVVGLQNPGVWRHRKKGGAIIDVEIASHPIKFRGVECMLVAAHDVTERKRAEDAVRRAEEKYRGFFEDAVVGIFQATPDGQLTSINPTLAQMHGYDSPEELMAEVHNVAQQLFVDPRGMVEMVHGLTRHGVVRGAEVEVYCRDLSRKWVRVNAHALRDADGNATSYEGTVEDITEHKAAEERVKFLAYYDALTELPHRTLLQDRLENAIAAARHRGEKIALLFLDLDRFKAVNDSYGHSFGDLVLKEIAKRLKECAGEHNTVARVGGDEFLVMLSSVEDEAEAAFEAGQMIEAMSQDFRVLGQSIRMGCSIGVSLFPDHGDDGETLIRNADAAMFSAKDGGRNNVRFFTEAMNAQAVERLTMEKDLRLALEREEFFLLYQPQMDLGSGRVTGLEALIRWQHPELGLILPDRFISIAESNGLILSIGEWVLRTACAQVRNWQEAGFTGVPVAVNVSALQFRQESFRDIIRRALEESGLGPECLELELTESLLLSNADLTLSVLQELKEMGLKLAIDDFGTGYSSFSYLRHFAVDKLKIDKMFIRDIGAGGGDAAIISAILSLAKSMHLKVIAEGVENEGQMAFLRGQACDQIQGHYFSEPLSASDVAILLRQEQGEEGLRRATARVS
ncbi:MAG TPA: EAL domain-containing protein [Acidobacteriaceae bacterium]